MAGLWPWTCTRLFPGLMFHLDQTLGVSGQPQSCPTLGVLPSIPAGCLAHGGIHGMWSPSMDGGSQKGLHHEWSLLSALIMTDPLGFACWEWDCCLTFMWGRVVSLGWRPVEQVWWRLRQGLCRPQRMLESGLAGHLGAQGPELSSACFPLFLVRFLGWRYITLPWDHRYLPQSMFMGFFYFNELYLGKLGERGQTRPQWGGGWLGWATGLSWGVGMGLG